jgi:hypothetical protein
MTELRRPMPSDLESWMTEETWQRFTAATIIHAEGARIGIMTCRDCGSALVLDSRETFDVIERHRAWHLEISDGR